MIKYVFLCISFCCFVGCISVENKTKVKFSFGSYFKDNLIVLSVNQTKIMRTKLTSCNMTGYSDGVDVFVDSDEFFVEVHDLDINKIYKKSFNIHNGKFVVISRDAYLGGIIILEQRLKEPLFN